MLFEITSTLSTMAADESIYKLAAADTGTTDIPGTSAKGTVYTVTWSDATSLNASDYKIGTVVLPEAIYSYMAKVLTNGLPKSQTGKGFTLTISLTANDGGSANVYVNCVAN